MQIYKSILEFKNREPNPYGYKISYSFRYNTFIPIQSIVDVKPSSKILYVYILSNMPRYHVSDESQLESVLIKSMTINLHPDRVGIHRQHIKEYLDELVSINFISKVGERGYDYYVNPYYYNTLSRTMTHFCFTKMLLVLQQEPLCLVE